MSRWLERLLNKKVRLSKFKEDAQSWDTCAVGEIHEDFPDVVVMAEWDDEPEDKRLTALGLEFGNAVERNQRPKALKLYRAIHRRLERLIAKGGR